VLLLRMVHKEDVLIKDKPTTNLPPTAFLSALYSASWSNAHVGWAMMIICWHSNWLQTTIRYCRKGAAFVGFGWHKDKEKIGLVVGWSWSELCVWFAGAFVSVGCGRRQGERALSRI